MILARVEFALLLCLEKLQLEEELHELLVSFDICLQVDAQQRLHALEAFSVLAHRRVVDWVPSEGLILLA